MVNCSKLITLYFFFIHFTLHIRMNYTFITLYVHLLHSVHGYIYTSTDKLNAVSCRMRYKSYNCLQQQIHLNCRLKSSRKSGYYSSPNDVFLFAPVPGEALSILMPPRPPPPLGAPLPPPNPRPPPPRPTVLK